MALIPQDELAVLKSASEVKSVSEEAPLEAEKMAIAKLINSAANTGVYSVLYNHEISDAMKEILEGMSYTVTRRPASICADPKFQYIISWQQLSSNSESTEEQPSEDIPTNPDDNNEVTEPVVTGDDEGNGEG